MRSYSSLLILKALMERVEAVLATEAAPKKGNRASEIDRDAPNASRVRPADIFGFMSGSSTGG